MNKVLSVWKPKNITSYDIIRKVKSINNSFKIGHCGTLDPFAEGIVILCFGEYTKRINQYMNYNKTYLATIKLGCETDTLDNTGEIIKSNKDKLQFNREDLSKILSKYIGEIYQIPPYFSAKKINGIRMYRYARNDIFIKPKPFKIKINSIDVIDFTCDTICLKIDCEKGTYIRSLARDISYELNTFGYLSKLERISIGNFNKDNSLSLKELESCISID